jgi:hypothetical protein
MTQATKDAFAHTHTHTHTHTCRQIVATTARSFCIGPLTHAQSASFVKSRMDLHGDKARPQLTHTDTHTHTHCAPLQPSRDQAHLDYCAIFSDGIISVTGTLAISAQWCIALQVGRAHMLSRRPATHGDPPHTPLDMVSRKSVSDQWHIAHRVGKARSLSRGSAPYE